MEVTFWMEIIFSVIFAAIIGIIAGLASKRCNDGKVGLGCGIMFPIAILVFLLLKIYLSSVTVITYDNGTFSHEKVEYFGTYTNSFGKETSVSIGKSYIANTTDEPLLLYPVYYGPKNKQGSVKEADPVLIEPYSIIPLTHQPDKYFSAPANQISTKSNSIEVRWILEPLATVAQREGFSIDDIYY